MADDDNQSSDSQVLKQIARELVTIRQLVSDAVNSLRGAEKEVPEYMRRFANYYHDIHDIGYMYEDLGHQRPPHLLREVERCDDRFRQLLEKLHTDGGAFEKIRREMTGDPANKWDHTRLLDKPQEKP